MTMENLKTTLEAFEQDLKKFRDQQTDKIEALDKKYTQKMEVSEVRPQTSLKAELYNGSSATALLQYMRAGDRSFDTKALSTGEVPGSYMLPSVVQERIHQVMDTYPSLRSVARIMTISSGSVEVIVDRDLPQAGWVEERGERPETNPSSLAKITIPVHEVYAKPRTTQKLLDDAALNIEEWLVSKVAEKMVRLENHSFIHGNGEGKPKGLLTYETCGGEVWEWGKIEHLITGRNGEFGPHGPDLLIDLVESMKTEYLSDCVWLMPRSVQGVVRKFKEQGNNGQYLWQPGLEGTVGKLLGYPVLLMDEMPTLIPGRASKSVIFGNFKEAYQIVDRATMSVLRDPYSSKPYVEFYITKRVGGDVINFEALKVINFSERPQAE